MVASKHIIPDIGKEIADFVAKVNKVWQEVATWLLW